MVVINRKSSDYKTGVFDATLGRLEADIYASATVFVSMGASLADVKRQVDQAVSNVLADMRNKN